MPSNQLQGAAGSSQKFKNVTMLASQIQGWARDGTGQFRDFLSRSRSQGFAGRDRDLDIVPGQQPSLPDQRQGLARDGTVPRNFVPVPLVPQTGINGTGISTLSRDNRSSLIRGIFEPRFILEPKFFSRKIGKSQKQEYPGYQKTESRKSWKKFPVNSR